MTEDEIFLVWTPDVERICLDHVSLVVMCSTRTSQTVSDDRNEAFVGVTRLHLLNSQEVMSVLWGLL